MRATTEADIIVIGSGIGGLAAGALAARYGLSVTVVESHTIPGGCAHSFERGGYTFDSGPSLWAGMSGPSTNPLRQVLDAVGEDAEEWFTYDGWMMHTPSEGSWRFIVGPDDFETAVLPRLGGDDGVRTWRELQQAIRPLVRAAVAIPPLALRGDAGGALTLFPHLLRALRTGGASLPRLPNAFTDVLDGVAGIEPGSFLYRWLDYLSFALSGLPASGTQTAAVVYTLADLHRPDAVLDYPRGGSGAVIDALVRGLEKHGGLLRLGAHVEEVVVEGGRAVGVRLRGAKGEVLRAHKAVISNASVWDTMRLLPPGAVPPEYTVHGLATPDTASFMHLHLGIDAAGLEGTGLEIHHTVLLKGWDPIDEEENMYIVSIPTVLDPALAPPGKHVVHCYAAGNEPYGLWEGLKRNTLEYEAMKRRRAEPLWEALEKIIPDIRARTELELIGSPLTHERFVRRHRGSYGPGYKAGQEAFPGPKTPLKGLLHCGDSTLPGIGVPAVAASGMNAANTAVSVWQHLLFLREMEGKGLVKTAFDGF